MQKQNWRINTYLRPLGWSALALSIGLLQACGSGDDGAGKLSAACSNCGAKDNSTYTGSGVGVWRYDNVSGGTATLDIKLNNVGPGNKVTLLFSNGQSVAVGAAPGVGTTSSSGTEDNRPTYTVRKLSAPASGPASPSLHDLVQQRNERVAQYLLQHRAARQGVSQSVILNAVSPDAAPIIATIGATRTWNGLDLVNSGNSAPIPYQSTAFATCALPDGRTGVFWKENSVPAFTPTQLADLTRIWCAADGGYAKVTGILGSVWGAKANDYDDLIRDGKGDALQPVNIVFAPLQVANVGGYFDLGNGLLRDPSSALAANSNEALVFFANSSMTTSNENMVWGVLLHELTHMISYYQHTVVLHQMHDSWLEETGAIMTEGIVNPQVNGGADGLLAGRLSNYLSSGAGYSYIDWEKDAYSYALAGSFNWFLVRQYGLSIYKGIIYDCDDVTAQLGEPGSTSVTSYACYDKLIRKQGGTGFAEEFARFGASVFSGMPAASAPAHFGFPAKTDPAYPGFPLVALNPDAPAAAAKLSNFPSTSHTYLNDSLATGQTRYTRNGVSVPAGTTLMVVVQ